MLMSVRQYHLKEHPIPNGYQIYAELLEVKGITSKKKHARRFAKANRKWLELEADPHNEYDKNAIEVVGCWESLFGIKRRSIGFVPKEVSKLIAEKGFSDRVLPRLYKTYLGDSGFVEVEFQLLGPKGEKDAFSKERIIVDDQ